MTSPTGNLKPKTKKNFQSELEDVPNP